MCPKPTSFTLALQLQPSIVGKRRRQHLLARLGMNPRSHRPPKLDKNNGPKALKVRSVLVLIAILPLSFWAFWCSPQSQIAQVPLTVGDSPSLPFFWSNTDFPSRTGASSSRPVYPYSVIPRGVETPEELRSAIRQDSVVAAHYSDFQVRAARPIRLPRERQFFVSYRIGNQVYWTTKKITLHAGETLLTDGEHLARTRCGNRLSEVPASPTTPSEPSDHTFNTPVVPLRPELTSEPLPDLPIWPGSPAPVPLYWSSATPEPAPGPGGFIPPFIPICCLTASGTSSPPNSPIHPAPSSPSPSPSSPTLPLPPPYPPSEPLFPPQPSPPPIAAPEPGVLTLAAAGLILLLILRRLRPA